MDGTNQSKLADDVSLVSPENGSSVIRILDRAKCRRRCLLELVCVSEVVSNDGNKEALLDRRPGLSEFMMKTLGQAAV